MEFSSAALSQENERNLSGETEGPGSFRNSSRNMGRNREGRGRGACPTVQQQSWLHLGWSPAARRPGNQEKPCQVRAAKKPRAQIRWSLEALNLTCRPQAKRTPEVMIT